MKVLLDRICRENGIEHLLTEPGSRTTTGKIERFHCSLRAGSRTPDRKNPKVSGQGRVTRRSL